MAASRGWTSDWTEVQLAQFLVWVSQHSGERLQKFAESQERGLDREALKNIVSRCKADGLIREAGSLAGVEHSSASLSDAGSVVVQGILRDRRNRRLRALAARDAVLDWLYEFGSGQADPSAVESIRPKPQSFFKDDPFSDDELQQASSYLAERGLVTGIPVAQRDDPLRPRITSDGRACVEQYDGSVVAWEQRGRRETGDTFQQNIGTVYGMAAQGRNIEQTQHQGLNPAQVRDLLQTVRDAARDLDEDESDDLDLQLRDLEAEVSKPTPNAEIVERRVGRLQRIASRVGNPALTAAVSAATTQLFQLLGWA